MLGVIARMNSTTHQRSRPVAVIVAVILLAIGMTIRFMHVFGDTDAHVDKLAIYIFLALLVSVPYLVMWFIFRGKNWARLVFFVVFGLALCSIPISIQRLLTQPVLDIAVYCVQL